MSESTTGSTVSRGHLLAVLGVGFGIAVTIGNAIGAGILRTPGVVAAHLQTLWPFLLVWLIGALYAMLGANALAELGTLVPRSGGQYVFVRHGLGDYAGFVVGWSDWISTCGTTAAVAIVVGENAVALVPQARAPQVIALVLVAVLTTVQWFGTRAGGLTQDITSLIKALALMALIGACIFLGTRTPFDGTSAIVDREESIFLAIVLALPAVIYTYDGWSAIIYFSEEVKDPGKSIPRSMLGGVLGITLLYLFVNLAFLCVVSLPTIAGKDLAAGVVAERLFGPHGNHFVRGIVAVLMISAVNSNVLMAPRVLYAMARDRLFWHGATEVNRRGTPDIALLISSIFAALFIVAADRVETLLAALAFFFVANYSLSFLALFVLRAREPNAVRPYRAWGHPFTTGLALLASLAFLGTAVMQDAHSGVYALALLAVSFPVYIIMKKSRR
jgi:APA family basic amino acid/polyamine antiporter